MLRYLLAAAMLVLAWPAQAETGTIRIGIQPGMTYLALNTMNREKILEKKAQEAGLDLKVEWIVSANGAVLNDGVLSGNVDIAGTGIPAFVTLWAKGRGPVDARGIAAYGSMPGKMVTTNPNLRSIKDFTSTDRIALPAPKASIQAILLAMMAEKTWGPGQAGRLDPLMVGLSHPDAMIALMSGQSEIKTHFTSSPYYDEELKLPGAHVVLDKEDIFPGPLTHGMLWTTGKFHSQNPKTMRAFRAALDEAMALIQSDPDRAADAYLSLAREKIAPAEAKAIVRNLKSKFETTPHGIHAIATFMHHIGMIKIAPASWKDLFFEDAWSLDGS